jgi:transcriptional regulator with XRE-family HTH domain
MGRATFPEQEILARNVRGQRERLGLSQSELARRAGINRGYLIMLEDAEANPSLYKLSCLGTVLSVSVSTLLRE